MFTVKRGRYIATVFVHLPWTKPDPMLHHWRRGDTWTNNARLIKAKFLSNESFAIIGSRRPPKRSMRTCGKGAGIKKLPTTTIGKAHQPLCQATCGVRIVTIAEAPQGARSSTSPRALAPKHQHHICQSPSTPAAHPNFSS